MDLLPSDDDGPEFEVPIVRICGNTNCRQYAQHDKRLCVKCAISTARYQASDKRRATRAAYGRTDACKAQKKKWRGTAKGRAEEKKLWKVMSRSLWAMLKGHNQSPVTFPRLGIFTCNDDVTAHFVSTFETWMTLENRGKYEHGDGYKVKWNVGHRIPKTLYDHDDEDDIKRAWSRDNLFAQCARENCENNNILTLSDDQLIDLKSIWPKAATTLAELKGLFERKSAPNPMS